MTTRINCPILSAVEPPPRSELVARSLQDHRFVESELVAAAACKGPPGRRTTASQRGFTLVEMSIVVVIISILAMLAIVAYRKLITSSHTAEATQMIQSIRVAQEAYRAETQQYANISTSLTGAPYPNTTPGRSKTMWGAACSSNCNASPTWAELPLHVDGPVMFGYTTVAGVQNSAPSPASVTFNGQTATFPNPSPTDWFLIAAKGDTDGNGIYCSVYGTSWSNDLYIDNEGE